MSINTPQGRYSRHLCICLFALTTTVIFFKPGLAVADGDTEIVPDNVYTAFLTVVRDLEALRLLVGAPQTNKLAGEYE